MPHFFERKFKDWQDKVKKQGLDFRQKNFSTLSQIPVQPFYPPLDSQDYEVPGVFPFTRGVQSSMYLGKLWTMRQYAGFGSAEESNARYLSLIGSGASGLSVAFDLPTQMGLDSDHPLAFGEVGKAGVAIDTFEDMEILFKGIDLSQVSTSMTINATAPILLALYILVAEKQGVPLSALKGTLQNDILKEYMARGTYVFGPQPSMRLLIDVIEYTQKYLKGFNPISISGYHIREAGCDAVQEVAFTLSSGLAYVDAAIKRGLKIDDFAKRLSFFFNAHNCFFEEVAKFRAARRLWAKLLKERYEAKDESCLLRFHTQTAGSTLTAQQIDNNVVRVAYQALAAVLGGTQSLHTNAKDEALALPTKASATLALRTQQILAYETGVADTIDPLAGSYYVETLTQDIETKALEYIKTIDQMGSMTKAIQEGYPQREIEATSFKTQTSIENKSLKIVGVNCFTDGEGANTLSLLKVSQEVQTRQQERLKAFKQHRDISLCHTALIELENAAKGTENLIPFILKALKNKATLGEITQSLKNVLGVYEGHDTF